MATPARAGFDPGWYAYTAGDFALAKSEWLPLGEAGDARAQFQLGLMHQQGKGFIADSAEAARWYRLAADQGHSPSQINLAHLYYKGLGVAHDHAEAARLAERAATYGNSDAQFFMGTLYHHGHGVPVDLVKSHMWLSLAVMRGSKSARERLSEVERLMTSTEIATAETMRQELMNSN